MGRIPAALPETGELNPARLAVPRTLPKAMLSRCSGSLAALGPWVPLGLRLPPPGSWPGLRQLPAEVAPHVFPEVHKMWSPHPKVTSIGSAQRMKAQPCRVGFWVSDVMLPSPGRASLVPGRRHSVPSLARPWVLTLQCSVSVFIRAGLSCGKHGSHLGRLLVLTMSFSAQCAMCLS